MSDFKPTIYARFINRRTGLTIKQIPVLNRITVNKDIRQLCDSFDFDIMYRVADKIDLHSHDFVEFYFYIDGKYFQISCGFIEDFTKETSSSTHTFRANGRDFLGQFFNMPFLKARALARTTIVEFVKSMISQGYTTADESKAMYLQEYLKYKNIPQPILDQGADPGTLLVPELSDAKIAPVMQQLAEEIHNAIYQDRNGQVVIWGQKFLDANDTKQTIYELEDSNSQKFTLRESFSKVFSEVKVFYTGGENQIDYRNTPSKPYVNTDKRAAQIFQPEIRTFQTSTLVTTAGEVNYFDKKNGYAKSIIRKSNQNLYQVTIQTERPFYLTDDGRKIPYEVNQLWTISSESNKLNESMRLAAISYTQNNNSLECILLFIPKDSLV